MPRAILIATVGLFAFISVSARAADFFWVGYQNDCMGIDPDVGSYFHGDNWHGYALPGPNDDAVFGSGFDPQQNGLRPHEIHFGDVCLNVPSCPGNNHIPGGLASVRNLRFLSDSWTLDMLPASVSCSAGATVGSLNLLNGGFVLEDASLSIRGGLLTSSGAVMAIIGSGVPNIGNLSITGASTIISGQGEVWVGQGGGQGNLTIANGADLIASGISVNLSTGQSGEISYGEITASDPGTYIQGLWGINNGVVQILNGAIASALRLDGTRHFAFIGERDSAIGEVIVSGAGSKWEDVDWLTVGGVYHTNTTGNGKLTISNGARVLSQRGIVSQQPLSIGEVNIDGEGSQWSIATVLQIGIGQGSFIVSNGGNATASQISISANGVIKGNGSLTGAVFNSGKVRPGLSSGILSISGNYSQQQAGSLYMELGGISPGSQHDQLQISGTTSLNGTLNITTINGFSPSIGQSFTLMTYASRIGQFSNITGMDFGSGLVGVLDYGAQSLTLSVRQTSSFSVQPTSVITYAGFPSQLTAIANLVPSETTNVSGSAIWTSDNPLVASVNSIGRIQGVSPGSTVVQASFGGYDASAAVTVLELPVLPLQTDRVNLGVGQQQANGTSDVPAISANGRFVAFWSTATNLVSDDTNAQPDLFVRVLQTNVTERVSVSTANGQANGASESVCGISGDGRYVVYSSFATNLVESESNGQAKVFLRDRMLGETTCISVGMDGSQANGRSGFPWISRDGRYITFYSMATNLVAGDTNGGVDCFVFDRNANVMARVSVASGGGQGTPPTGVFATHVSLSDDGRFAVFGSPAPDLVPNDTNGVVDIFCHDRQTLVTTRISVGASGQQANGTSFAYREAISGNGQIVVFQSLASNLVSNDTNGTNDLFMHERQSALTTRVNMGTGGSQDNGAGVGSGSISADSRFITWRSAGSNTVSGDNNGVDDAFVLTRATGTIDVASVSLLGEIGNGGSSGTALSSDGRYVVFSSLASNLAPNDSNELRDIFLRDRITRGDANCDGQSNGLDISAFMIAMLSPESYAAQFPTCFGSACDLDYSGSIDEEDVALFVDQLLEP